MFTDHMLFSGESEQLWSLVTLYLCAMSIRIQCPNLQSRNSILLHQASGCRALPNIFFPHCAIAAHIPQMTSDSDMAMAHVARKNVDLFQAERRVPANWKEETPC